MVVKTMANYTLFRLTDARRLLLHKKNGPRYEYRGPLRLVVNYDLLTKFETSCDVLRNVLDAKWA